MSLPSCGQESLLVDGDAEQLGGVDCVEQVEDGRGGGVGEVELHHDRLPAVGSDVSRVVQARRLSSARRMGER